MGNYMTKEAIMERMLEHYQEARKMGEVFGVFLQGSQNYIEDKFFEGSDVDTRAIMVPSAREIILKDEGSKKVHLMENEEHLDLLDIRNAVKFYKKPGINNFETLFTEYYVINEKYSKEFEELQKIREELAVADRKGFLMSTMGVSYRDLKTIQHRNGGQDADLEKYGYVRKRLSNIMRFNATVKDYIEGKPFDECLKALDQDEIHRVRREHAYEVNEALELANTLHEETKTLAEEYVANEKDSDVKERLDNWLVELLVKEIKQG